MITDLIFYAYIAITLWFCLMFFMKFKATRKSLYLLGSGAALLSVAGNLLGWFNGGISFSFVWILNIVCYIIILLYRPKPVKKVKTKHKTKK